MFSSSICSSVSEEMDVTLVVYFPGLKGWNALLCVSIAVLLAAGRIRCAL